MLALACLALQAQGPTLKSVGLEPNQTVVAKEGIASFPGEVRVELLGICRLGSKKLIPWGADGQPVDAEHANWFWHAIGHDPSKPKGIGDSDKAPDAVFLAFRCSGNASATHDFNSSLTIDTSYFKGAEGKFNQPTEGMRVTVRPNDKTLDLPMDVEVRKDTKLFVVDPEKEEWPQGWAFGFESSTSKAFKASKGKREDFLYRTYRVLALVPDEWKQVQLKLEPSDKPAKGDKSEMFVPSISTGFPAEQVDPSLKGNIAFMPAAKEVPGYKRTFTLFASNRHRAEFRELPLKPSTL